VLSCFTRGDGIAGLLRAMLVLELFLPDFLEHALPGDSMLARVLK